MIFQPKSISVIAEQFLNNEVGAIVKQSHYESKNKKDTRDRRSNMLNFQILETKEYKNILILFAHYHFKHSHYSFQ